MHNLLPSPTREFLPNGSVCLLLNDCDVQALLLYQAEQRKQWHLTVKSPTYTYDLSKVDEIVLHDARECIHIMICVLRFNSMRVETHELRPEMVTKDDGVLVHY